MMLATTPSTFTDYAMAYAAAPLGWKLCKLRPKSKAPMMANWNKQVIGADTAAAVFCSDMHGMGLVHEESGTGAFDVDSLEWARVAFADFGIPIDELLAGYPRIAGREGRDKIIFRLPPGLTTQKLVWPAPSADSKPITVFELRANGGQDVLPPSVHPDTGRAYEWVVDPFGFTDGIPMAPGILVALWTDWPSFKKQFEQACPWGPKLVDVPKAVVRQVSTEHGNVIGAFNAAYSIPELLKECGYRQRGSRWLSPSSSSGIAGVVVLKDSGKCFSHHTSDMLNDGHAHDAFDLFLILQHNNDFNAAIKSAARQLGIEKPRASVPAVDMSRLLENAGKEPKPSKKNDAEPRAIIPETPNQLLAPSGMVGTIVQHILATSHQPQPELAVAAALCLCATVLGRRVATSTGLRTNLQIIGVAKTAAGKEHARKINKDILLASRSSEFIGGEEIASGQGLVSRVAAHPVSLFQIDEFGLFLQAVQNPNAGSHKAEIVNNFIKMFSAATSIYYGTEYADQRTRPRVDIPHPCVVLYGTTTPETFFPALGSAHVASGYLNRMLVCMSPEKRPVRLRAGWVAPPQLIIDWVEAAKTLSDKSGGNISGTAENPVRMGEAKQAAKVFDDFQAEIDHRLEEADKSGNAALWGRAWEHAAKIAVVIELGKNLESRAVSGESATWAIEFVRHWTCVMANEISARVADSEFGRVVLDVMRVVKEAGSIGLTEHEIGRKFKAFKSLRPNERDQVFGIISRDDEAGWCQFPPQSGRGKGRHALVASEFIKNN